MSSVAVAEWLRRMLPGANVVVSVGDFSAAISTSGASKPSALANVGVALSSFNVVGIDSAPGKLFSTIDPSAAGKAEVGMIVDEKACELIGCEFDAI